jgi:predicted regulator of Ras-like GTPase activity (Roadblock/LC7/MglB family)
MAGKREVDAIGRLDGVTEATLCGHDGGVLESSSANPRLGTVAANLERALHGVRSSLPGFAGAMSLAIEADEGALQFTLLDDATLIVSTEAETNLGVLRMEIREALQS